jgi:hypothetical protein
LRVIAALSVPVPCAAPVIQNKKQFQLHQPVVLSLLVPHRQPVISREIREIRERTRAQWNDLNVQLREQAAELRLLDPTREEKFVCLIPDDLLDSDEDDAESDSESELVGDPPSFPQLGPFEPPDEGEPGLVLVLLPRSTHPDSGELPGDGYLPEPPLAADEELMFAALAKATD